MIERDIFKKYWNNMLGRNTLSTGKIIWNKKSKVFYQNNKQLGIWIL